MLGCQTSENSSPKQYIKVLRKDLMMSPWTYSKFAWSQISLRRRPLDQLTINCLLKLDTHAY